MTLTNLPADAPKPLAGLLDPDRRKEEREEKEREEEEERRKACPP